MIRRTKTSAAKAPARKPPPFKSRSHRVTKAKAKQMRARYRRRNAKNRSAMQPGVYARSIFDRILAQEGCAGIRLYPALDERGRQTTLIVGVDAKGDDLAGIFGDVPWLCPPYCSSVDLFGG